MASTYSFRTSLGEQIHWGLLRFYKALAMKFCTGLIRNRYNEQWTAQTAVFFNIYWLEKEQVTISGPHRWFFTATMCDVNKYSKRVCVLLIVMDTFPCNSRYRESKIGMENHRLIFPTMSHLQRAPVDVKCLPIKRCSKFWQDGMKFLPSIHFLLT